MKKGKVKVLSLSAKNLNHVYTSGDVVTENDVENFDALVEKGFITPDQDYLKAELAKAKQAQKNQVILEKENAKKAEEAKADADAEISRLEKLAKIAAKEAEEAKAKADAEAKEAEEAKLLAEKADAEAEKAEKAAEEIKKAATGTKK